MNFCPKCEAPARVLEKRWSQKKACTRRRLGCPSCGYRFSIFGDIMIPQIDNQLDSEGMPKYTETLQVLEALVRSAGGCASIDQVAVVKAWRLIDRYNAIINGK